MTLDWFYIEYSSVDFVFGLVIIKLLSDQFETWFISVLQCVFCKNKSLWYSLQKSRIHGVTHVFKIRFENGKDLFKLVKY